MKKLTDIDVSLALFITFAIITGTAMGMLKILAPLFALRLGATPAQIGIISSVENFCGAAMTLPAGLMVARFGANRIYLIGSIGAMVAFFAAPWSVSWSALAVVVGVAAAVAPFRIVALGGAFMARLPEFGKEKAGWYRGGLSTGTLLLGPFIGTLILEQAGVTPAYLAVSAFYAFMTITSPKVFLPSEHTQGSRIPLSKNFLSLAELLRHPVVGPVCGIEFCSGLTMGGFSSFIVVVAIKLLGLSEPAAVSLQFFEGLIAVATMFLGGHALRNTGPLLLYRLSMFLMVGGLLLLGTAYSYIVMVAGTLSFGAGLGFVHIVNVQRLSATDADKGKISSVQILSSMVGAFLGALLAGTIAQFLGLSWVFLFSALIYLIFSIRWCRGRQDAAVKMA